MILRPPDPDELLKAYFPRLRRENQVEDNASLAVKLELDGSGSKERLSRLPDVLEAIARRLCVDVRSLICQHSLVPFLKCIEPDRVFDSYRKFDDRCYMWHAFRNLGYPRMCVECVREDRATLGWSTWHRSHKIPGVYWCPKHRRLLSYAYDAVPFTEEPHHIFQAGEALLIGGRIDREVTKAIDNPVLQRYASLAGTLLDSLVAPVPRSVLAELVQQRCEIVGISTSCDGRQHLLSDFARDRVPERWMVSTFRESQRTRPELLASWIDRVGQPGIGPASPALSILAMALLWDDPDGAALQLSMANSAHQTVRYLPKLDAR